MRLTPGSLGPKSRNQVIHYAPRVSTKSGVAPTKLPCVTGNRRRQKRSSAPHLPLWPRPVVRRTLAQLQCAEIGRLAGKTIGDVGQDHATVRRRGSRLEPEIQVLGLVEGLNLLQILGIQFWNIDKDVVIDDDAVPILMCRPAVFGERREPAAL